MSTLKSYSTSNILNNGSVEKGIATGWMPLAYTRLHTCATSTGGTSKREVNTRIAANNMLAEMDQNKWTIVKVPSSQRSDLKSNCYGWCTTQNLIEIWIGEDEWWIFLTKDLKSITRCGKQIMAIEPSTSEGGIKA